jgi:cytosine/adenosine deaminase-related metal-dependent hydrolase
VEPAPDLLVHGDVLLASAAAAPLRDGALLIRDGAIAAVGEHAALRQAHPEAEQIGGPGMLVLPGLINAHHHGMAVSTVQLGFPDPGPPDHDLPDTAFESWMVTMLALDAVDPYLGTLLKDVHLLESGVTGHLHMHFPTGGSAPSAEQAYADELEQTLRAHRESGQRVTIAPHWRDRNRLVYDGEQALIAGLPAELQPGARRLAASSIRNEVYLETIRGLIAQLDGDPLLAVQFSIMAPQWASDALVRDVGEAASALGAGIHLHALESPLQQAWGDRTAGGRELERLVDAQVLGARSALAHGVWLRDGDIELLARVGATVVHNCSSNLRLVNGVAPLRRLVAAGASVALALDDMGIADDDDMLAEVRMAHVQQRVHGAAGDRRLTAAEAYGLAWDGGAKVIGAATTTGRLEVGRRADVVLLDLRALSAPYTVDDVDVWELLLSRGRAEHVRTVIVEGRVLLRDRRLTQIDREALVAEVAGAAASSVARRDPAMRPLIAALGRGVAEHYREWARPG